MPVLSATPLTTLERRKRWLKRLAHERATSWQVAVIHPMLDGATRLETAREILHLVDGICVASSPLDGSHGRRSALVGTRLVGWMTKDHRLVHHPFEDARALFWRRGVGDVTIALTAPMRSLSSVIPLTALTGTLPCVAPSARAKQAKQAKQEVTRFDRRIDTLPIAI